MIRRLLPFALVAACGGAEGDFLIVTVDTRPAVHDISELIVTLSNDGTSLEDRYSVTTQTFPATFSVSAPGRIGVLGISVDAKDRDGLLVGRGFVETTVESPTAAVLLDSADFVVNTEFADDQFPSDDFEANGFQVSAASDGTWTVAYRDSCVQPCRVFARRFDTTGRAVESAIAAGTNGFQVSEIPTLGVVTPAVATAGATTIAVWDFAEPSPSTIDGIACRAFDADGNAVSDQLSVSVEALPDVVSVTALSNSTFAVSWNGFMTDNIIKSAIVNAQCESSNIVQVSQTVGTSGASRGSVAANGDRVMYAWIVDGEVRGRIGDNTNTFITADIPIVARNATERIEHVRVAPLGTGFAVVVRWSVDGAITGPGRLELYRTNNGGALMGGPTLVTTRSGTDFDSKKSFGVASRSEDGALLIVWHSCEENGDDSGCGVFGRMLRPSGVPVGDEFLLATTTELDQTSPAAVAIPGAFAATWKDTSRRDPDKSGSAARARVLYPAFDDAKGVIGATCSGSDCNAGLVCGASSEGGQRCFASCNPEGTPPLCPGGGTCSTATGGSACVF